MEHRDNGGAGEKCGLYGIAVLFVTGTSRNELSLDRTLDRNSLGTGISDLEALCLFYLVRFLQEHQTEDRIVQFGRISKKVKAQNC
jgi:hypothetical protein